MEEGGKNVDFLGNYDGADERLEKNGLPAGKEKSAQALVSSELGGVSGSQKLRVKQSIDRVVAQVVSDDGGEEPRGKWGIFPQKIFGWQKWEAWAWLVLLAGLWKNCLRIIFCWWNWREIFWRRFQSRNVDRKRRGNI